MSTSDPLLGRQLANFRIERLLGRGGMAHVYYGWDVKLKRPVALKVIDARFRDNPAYAQRFIREAQSVSTWRQENIAQVYYADNEGDLYYFVMEYIDGFDLGKLLNRYAARGELMPSADVLRLGRAVAGALDYAHQKGIIHRDVKPSNVMLGRDGRVVLSDFGLALDVQEGSMGEVFGSAHYIAPEQARRSSDAVAQSDLYSLGVMLYEMLTGVVPFDDPSPTTVALQHLTLKPPLPREINPDLSPAVEAVLLKALDKTHTERYQTGQELITALETALRTTQTVSGERPLPPPPAGVSPATTRLSQLSVADLLQAQPEAPAVSPPKKSPTRASQPRTMNPTWWLAFGGCGFLLVVSALLGGGLLATRWKTLFAPVTSSTPATPTAAQPTVAPITSPPDATVVETALSTPTTPASATLKASAAPGPTVKYPDGQRLRLYYDENSFYLLNLSESILPISDINLERLDASDVPLNRFEGSRWARFYSKSEPQACMAIEIRDSPSYLRPAQCLNRYLSTRTPARDDPGIFWTTQADSRSSQFRVLWKDEEVARCEISVGTCEVFVP